MTAIRAFSRRVAPEACLKFALENQRAQGMPGAGWHPRSRVQDALKNAHTSIQVQPEQPGIPCAMVLRLMPSSPWRRIPLASIADELTARMPGWALQTSASLTPATGARTTRFCRTQLPPPNHSASQCRRPNFWRKRLSAVRLRADVRSRKTALRTPLAPDAAASTATRPNVRDDGQRPSSRDGMAGVVGVIWVRDEAEYFCGRGWTGQISLKLLEKIAHWRSGADL